MTFDEKLKEIENLGVYEGLAPLTITRIFAALRRCREQRRFNAKCAIDDDIGVLPDEKARTLEIAEEEDDAEILEILEGK